MNEIWNSWNLWWSVFSTANYNSTLLNFFIFMYMNVIWKLSFLHRQLPLPEMIISVRVRHQGLKLACLHKKTKTHSKIYIYRDQNWWHNSHTGLLPVHSKIIHCNEKNYRIHKNSPVDDLCLSILIFHWQIFNLQGEKMTDNEFRWHLLMLTLRHPSWPTKTWLSHVEPTSAMLAGLQSMAFDCQLIVHMSMQWYQHGKLNHIMKCENRRTRNNPRTKFNLSGSRVCDCLYQNVSRDCDTKPRLGSHHLANSVSLDSYSTYLGSSDQISHSHPEGKYLGSDWQMILWQHGVMWILIAQKFQVNRKISTRFSSRWLRPEVLFVLHGWNY